jgi:hypothetical protein
VDANPTSAEDTDIKSVEATGNESSNLTERDTEAEEVLEEGVTGVEKEEKEEQEE